METIDHLAEKILTEFTNALDGQFGIDEFDIIPHPSVNVQNKNPVIQIGTKLGIESWCIKPVFSYCYNKLLVESRRDGVFCGTANQIMMATLTLLIQPELQTLWNLRKKWIEQNYLGLKDDLYLTELVLTRKPKSLETFNQRKWLHQKMTFKKKDVKLNRQFANKELLENEFSICTAAADKYPNNYHAWSHRIWMLQQFGEENVDILESELTASKIWCQKHVSDHSGLHYRQFLMNALTTNVIITKNERLRQIKNLFLAEIKLCNELIINFSGHEALWNHRRYILHHISNLNNFSIESEGNETKRTKIDQDAKNSIYSLQKEIDFMSHDKCANSNDKSELYLINQHRKWISKFCKTL